MNVELLMLLNYYWRNVCFLISWRLNSEDNPSLIGSHSMLLYKHDSRVKCMATSQEGKQGTPTRRDVEVSLGLFTNVQVYGGPFEGLLQVYGGGLCGVVGAGHGSG